MLGNESTEPSSTSLICSLFHDLMITGNNQECCIYTVFFNQWNYHKGIESSCNLRKFQTLWKGEIGRELTMARTPYCFSTLSFSCLKHASILSWNGLRASVTFSPWIRMPSARNGIWKAEFGCSTLPSPSRAEGCGNTPRAVQELTQ